MLPLSKIPTIITEGKLKTYDQGTSFLKVYYAHPTLGARSFYLFIFTTHKHHFIEAKHVTVEYLPIKYKPKVYGRVIENLMHRLVKEIQQLQATD